MEAEREYRMRAACPLRRVHAYRSGGEWKTDSELGAESSGERSEQPTIMAARDGRRDT